MDVVFQWFLTHFGAVHVPQGWVPGADGTSVVLPPQAWSWEGT